MDRPNVLLLYADQQRWDALCAPADELPCDMPHVSWQFQDVAGDPAYAGALLAMRRPVSS